LRRGEEKKKKKRAEFMRKMRKLEGKIVNRREEGGRDGFIIV
jgi:hypothetical protein